MSENIKTKKISSICEVFADGDWIEKKDQSKSGIRLIQTGNIGEGFFKDRLEKARYISSNTFTRLKCTEVLPGDILISRLPDPVGRAAILPTLGDKMITAVDCTIVRLKSDYLPKFLIYYTQSQKYLSDVNNETTGTTRKRISRKKLADIVVPDVDYNEQKRIVSILDEVFEKIEKLQDNSTKDSELIRSLFESYLVNLNAPFLSLGEMVNIVTGKLNANAAVESGEYPFFTCSRQVFAIDKYAFDTEAVLLAGNNASGDFNVKHYKGKFNAYQRTYVITIPEENTLRYRFLYFQLLRALKEFKEQSVGANTRFLKIGMIRDLKIPVPSIKKQDEILKNLEKLQELTDTLSENKATKNELLNNLKKSILKKAFSGKL